MWECSNCKQEIEDRYGRCWNCGSPKTETAPVLSNVRIHKADDTPPAENVRIHQVEDEPPAEVVSTIESPTQHKVVSTVEDPTQHKFLSEDVAPPEFTLLSNEVFSSGDKPAPIIIRIIPVFLWLAAVVTVAVFIYYANQKREAFINRNLEEAQALNNQKAQFVFSKNAKREKGNVKGKVLPLNANNNEVNDLYYSLPDDLRPANLEEVKTFLWLDCRSDNVWRYPDDSVGYREKCLSYLVDRETSKNINIQDFLGEMPPLTKKEGTGDAVGRVLPAEYISYIKENQLESERTKDNLASDSPDYCFFGKSEIFYSIILLCFLGTIGIGWLVFKLKSVLRPAN